MQVEVIQLVRFSPGYVLTLNKRQAEARKMNLSQIKGSNFEVVKPVEFKVGEVLGVGEIGKDLLPNLIVLDEKKE